MLKKMPGLVNQDPDDAPGDRDRKKRAQQHGELDDALANFLKGGTGSPALDLALQGEISGVGLICFHGYFL